MGIFSDYILERLFVVILFACSMMRLAAAAVADAAARRGKRQALFSSC